MRQGRRAIKCPTIQPVDLQRGHFSCEIPHYPLAGTMADYMRAAYRPDQVTRFEKQITIPPLPLCHVLEGYCERFHAFVLADTGRGVPSL